MEELMNKLQKERMEAANAVLVKGYRGLNPDDEDYISKLTALSKLHKEVAGDVKTYNDKIIEREKLKNDIYKADSNKQIEDAKIKAAEEQNLRSYDIDMKRIDADKYKCDESSIIESEKVRITEEQNQRMHDLEERKYTAEMDSRKLTHKRDMLGLGLDTAKVLLGTSLGLLGLSSRLWMFNRASKFEENDAYVTLTQKTTVQDAFRETGSLEKKWELLK